MGSAGSFFSFLFLLSRPCATWADVGCFITVSAPPGSVMYIALWNKEESVLWSSLLAPGVGRVSQRAREAAGQQKTPAARHGLKVTSERSLSHSRWINELIRAAGTDVCC